MCALAQDPQPDKGHLGSSMELFSSFTKKEAFELTLKGNSKARVDRIQMERLAQGKKQRQLSQDLDFIMSSILLEMEEEVGMARDEHDQVAVCIMKGLVCPRSRMEFHHVGQESQPQDLMPKDILAEELM